MKRKIFYIVHLDRNRILFLSLTFFSFLLFSFTLGRQLGNKQTKAESSPKFPLFSFLSTKKETLSRKEDFLLDKNKLSYEDNNHNEEEIVLSDYQETSYPKVIEKPKIKNNTQKKTNKNSPVLTSSNHKPNIHTTTANPITKTRSPKIQKTNSPQAISFDKKKVNKKVVIKKSQKKNNILRLANTSQASTSITQTRSKIKEKPKTKKSFQLQLGAFSSKEAAHRMKNELEKHGFRPYIEKRSKIHIVKIGHFKSKEEMITIKNNLSKYKYNSVQIKK